MKYDHQALEKHVLNRFIHGKPLILLDIPQVVYRKDIYTTGTFADVRKKVEPQVSTSASTGNYLIICIICTLSGETATEDKAGYRS